MRICWRLPATLLLLAVLHADGAEQRMNVLFLAADDLNSWLLGDPHRYSGKIVAPNILGLARSGVNFTRAYTASPVCSPSRTAFFSGVTPWRSGHYHNAPEVGKSEALGKALSLAGAFKTAGYSTYGYGKIRRNSTIRKRTPTSGRMKSQIPSTRRSSGN